MVAPACVVIHPPGKSRKSEVLQRAKSMAELVADDGSRCVGDLFGMTFVVCASTALHGFMAVKIAKLNKRCG